MRGKKLIEKDKKKKTKKIQKFIKTKMFTMERRKKKKICVLFSFG